MSLLRQIAPRGLHVVLLVSCCATAAHADNWHGLNPGQFEVLTQTVRSTSSS